jgi:thiopurine S-methyltransferase
MYFNRQYWNELYQHNQTPWDIGQASPPLLSYLNSLPDKNLRILYPGAGKSHEAVNLHKQGFYNLYVCDWAPDAFSLLQIECPHFPEDHLLLQDFFELEGYYDLILEQTFFCALHPSQRDAYVKKAAELLRPDGRLAGVLFATEFAKEGPPFGGSAEEYRAYFSPFFEFLKLESCYNSIKPRYGNELFIELVVKKPPVNLFK